MTFGLDGQSDQAEPEIEFKLGGILSNNKSVSIFRQNATFATLLTQPFPSIYVLTHTGLKSTKSTVEY